jgi:hypothetical protein
MKTAADGCIEPILAFVPLFGHLPYSTPVAKNGKTSVHHRKKR